MPRRRRPCPIATLDGDVFRGPHRSSGGGKAESRGILATKREIKELRERIAASASALEQSRRRGGRARHHIAHATTAIAALNAELHRQEKAIVGVEAQLQRVGRRRHALRSSDRAGRQIERRQAEESAGLDARQAKRASRSRGSTRSRARPRAFSLTRSGVLAMRATRRWLSAGAAEARATHAALIERAPRSPADVSRLEEAGSELEARCRALATDVAQMRDQRERLLSGDRRRPAAARRRRRGARGLRDELLAADERRVDAQAAAEQQEETIRDARRVARRDPRLAAELDVTRATAECGPDAPRAAVRRRRADAARRRPSPKSSRWSELAQVEPDVARDSRSRRAPIPTWTSRGLGDAGSRIRSASPRSEPRRAAGS